MSKTCFPVTNRELVWEFVGPKLGLPYSTDFRGALYVPNEFKGIPATKEAVAVAVGYNNFIGKTCQIHVIVQKPEFLTRAMICEAFEYPFRDCGLQHLLGLVNAANEDALRFDIELGFKEEFRIPHASSTGDDLVFLTMAKENCRWLRGEKNE